MTVNLQSFSDIITNSSSQVFVVYDEGNFEEFADLIDKIKKSFDYPWHEKEDWEWEKYDSPAWKEYDDDAEKWYDERKWNHGSGDGGDYEVRALRHPNEYEIHLDREASPTAEWIKENLKVLEHEWF